MESEMLKQQNDKQKKYIQIQRSKQERMGIDLEHYKRNPSKAKAPVKQA